MPSLSCLLQEVGLVSARSSFEWQCAHDPTEWKRLAFVREVELSCGEIIAGQRQNIISLGDSLHEQCALISVTRGLPNCCGKSLKFMGSPTVEQLIDQHELI